MSNHFAHRLEEKPRRIVLILAWGGVLIGLAALALPVAETLFAGGAQDGPHHGLPVPPPNDRKPDQEYELSKDFRVEAYDPQGDQLGPTIVLRKDSGEVLWSIRAIPGRYSEGAERRIVKRIRFTEHRDPAFGPWRLMGEVDWIHGKEETHFWISRDGRLQEFWFSM
jgi:hypothetical protein